MQGLARAPIMPSFLSLRATLVQHAVCRRKTGECVAQLLLHPDSSARAQGIVGTMPWIALGWLTLYLQLLGFSDLAAAVLNALVALGCALGSFCGGLLGAPLPHAHPRKISACLCVVHGRRSARGGARREAPRRSTALAALSDTDSTLRQSSTLPKIHMALVQVPSGLQVCLTCPAKLLVPKNMTLR